MAVGLPTPAPNHNIKTLTILNDTNFIHIKSSTLQRNIFTRIDKPSQAVTGYQLNVLLGPDFSSGTTSIPSHWPVGFGYVSTLSQYFRYTSNSSVNFIYSPNPAVNATSLYGMQTNIIFPEYAFGRPFDRFGIANIIYDPNPTSVLQSFPVGSGSRRLYPTAVSGELGTANTAEFAELDALRKKPKLLKFVYHQNHKPIRWGSTFATNDYAWDVEGGYWILQEITCIGGLKATFSNSSTSTTGTTSATGSTAPR